MVSCILSSVMVAYSSLAFSFLLEEGGEMRPWNGEKAEPELGLRLLVIRLGAVDAADECRLERLILS